MTATANLDADCIFCRIIRGEIPCLKLHEDTETFAFMDINPVQPGHALVVPKFHSKDLMETPAEWAASAFKGARRIAKAIEKTLDPDGINILQANGPGAAQSVFHLHVHVIPRAINDGLTMNWSLKPGDKDQISRLADRIRANVS
ncbi:MAG TPA: HIT family protein [Rhodospirillales bacterium]|jgi:histidine triad (HIT) family protein